MPETRGPLALVQAQDMSRVFHQAGQELIALSSASCAVFPGDRIAIIGPSGSGKSTLLHLLGGVDYPTSGSLTWPALVNGRSLRPDYISIALQTPDLLPALTVRENVAIPLLLMQTVPEEALDVAAEVLRKLGLGDLLEQLPEELSGGQAQRVVLARALAAQPRLILADEPTGQLDHPTARLLFDQLLAFIAETDCALVLATHDEFVSNRMSRQWNMHQGALVGDRNQ